VNPGRYSRQMPMLGGEGQAVLRQACIGVVGLGGLGSNAVTHLACAGVGRFVLVDGQYPEESNLNRQFIHSLAPSGASKAESAAAWVRVLNPDVEAVGVTGELCQEGVRETLCRCDLLLDCLDNHVSRMSLNDLVLENEIPLVHAAAQEWFGHITTVLPGRTPCLRCILPVSDEPTPAVIGSTTGVLGSLQASEAIKLLVGKGHTLTGRLLTLDLYRNEFQVLPIHASPDCPSCGGHV